MHQQGGMVFGDVHSLLAVRYLQHAVWPLTRPWSQTKRVQHVHLCEEFRVRILYFKGSDLLKTLSERYLMLNVASREMYYDEL